MAWFQERPHITLIKWPDWNPIENVWSWMKMQLASCNCTNIEELKGEIVRLWITRMSDLDYLSNLVYSMPRRLQEVIDPGGASTHY